MELRDQRAPDPGFLRSSRTLYCHLYTSSFFSPDPKRRSNARRVNMRRKRPFSKALTPAEYEEGKVVCPHLLRHPRTSIISPEASSCPKLFAILPCSRTFTSSPWRRP